MIRVMLVDDQTLVRQGIQTLLELEDDLQVVGTAGNGREAIEVVARARPDVVLMDVRMPQMDGVAATRELLLEQPGLDHWDVATEGMATAAVLGIRGEKAAGVRRTFEAANLYTRRFLDAHGKLVAARRRLKQPRLEHRLNVRRRSTATSKLSPKKHLDGSQESSLHTFDLFDNQIERGAAVNNVAAFHRHENVARNKPYSGRLSGLGCPDQAKKFADLRLGEPWEIAKVYWNRVPRGVLLEGFGRLRSELAEPGRLPFERAASMTDVPGVVDDHIVTTEIDGTGFAAAKAAAMRAHATQIEVAEPYFVLSNGLAQPLLTTEYYELVRGRREGGGRERDLFEGVPGISFEDRQTFGEQQNGTAL